MRKLFLLSLALAPLGLSAGDLALHIDLGHVSEQNFTFGQYSDLSKNGTVVNPGFSWRNDQLQIDASNLGLKTRELRLDWKSSAQFTAHYSESIQQKNDTGFSPFSGNSLLVLPQGWRAAQDTVGFNKNLITNRLSPHLHRRNLQLTLAKQSDSLRLEADVSVEQKQGETVSSAAIFSDAADARSTLLPRPVDYLSSAVSLSADYRQASFYITVEPRHIRFKNTEELLQWQNPYSQGIFPASNYPAFAGLPGTPDYIANSLTINTAYRLSPTTSFSVHGYESRTEQDQRLPVQTVNPLFNVVSTLPITHLDAALTSKRWQATLTDSSLGKLRLKSQYQFTERDNTADRYAFAAISGDGSNQPDNTFARFNRPLERQAEKFLVEASYRFKPGIRISARYEFEDTFRNYASVEDRETDTATLKLNYRPSALLTTGLNIAYEDAAGSTYEWSQSFFQSHTADFINRVPADQRWTNHPLLRQYHLANSEALSLKWFANLQHNESWHSRITFRFEDTQFDRSELGLTDNESLFINATTDYQPNEQSSYWLSLNSTRQVRLQRGRDFLGGINKPANRTNPPLPQASDPTRNYSVDGITEIHTLSAGGKRQLSARLDLTLELLHIVGSARHNISTAGARDLAGNDLPDNDYRLSEASLDLNYSLNPDLRFTLAYHYFRYAEDNFAIDGLTPLIIRDVFSSGAHSANENVNYLALTIHYQLGR